MNKKEKTYAGFKKLPPVMARKLAIQIKKGYRQGPHHNTEIGPSPAPAYTAGELEEITRAFILFNNAVQRGLPNQLYEFFARSLDSEISRASYLDRLVWLAHEQDGQAEEHAQDFLDRVLVEIHKRKKWNVRQFNREYLGGLR